MTAKKKILVIDDERIITKMIMDCLKPQYEVMVTYDGLSGLDMVEKEKPDLIICDLKIPKLSGAEFFSQVKEKLKIKNTPLIVITGAEPYEIEKAGIDKSNLLNKPFNIVDLRNIVKQKLDIV